MATVRRWSGREARALRLALRRSVRTFADHLGVSARTVSKWEQHGAATFPLPDNQAILDTALSRADDETMRRFEVLLANGEFDASGGTVDDVRRRTLLGLLGPIALGSPLALRSEPAGHDAADWEQVVNDYAREVYAVPPTRLLPNLVADFTEIHMRISEASRLIRTRLIHSASQLAALTAIALVNAGEYHAAQRWWRVAARAANETADPELAALVRGRQAVLSMYSAPPARVLHLADTAVELGCSRPCVGVISGLSARAQALAQLGRHGEARVALGAVTDMYPRLPGAATADASSEWCWAPYRLCYVESHIRSYAAQVDQAASAQDAALVLYPMSNWKGPTQIEIHRAASRICAGDTETGARHLTTVLERLLPWQRSDGRVLPIAMSTLELVPARQRGLPRFREARALVAGAVQEQ